ncbi:MAG: hypothetical protein WKG00_07930 [Polyangiaceae bacterium]
MSWSRARAPIAALVLVAVACPGCGTSFRISPVDFARARQGTVRTDEGQTVRMPARWSAEVHLDEKDDAHWMIPPNARTPNGRRPVRAVLIPRVELGVVQQNGWSDDDLEVGQHADVGPSVHLVPPIAPLGIPWQLEPGIWFVNEEGRRVELPLRAVESVEIIDADAAARRRTAGLGFGVFGAVVGACLIAAFLTYGPGWVE